MQLTSTLASLLLAAVTTGVQALPGSPVEERQAVGTIHVRYWSDNGCGATPGSVVVGEDIWVQDPVGRCIDINVGRDFGSTQIVTNLATHTARAYRLDNCAETGPNANYFDVINAPNQPRCFHQQDVESVKFL
ncbi:hypothetical protein KVR01_012907 [Diaporthe batatas]|uniref:uncharacterized protein n=1 Tax=Diaporthe batatas TaxID=748121 RepID=UPI001D049EC2|nr:uncharacterized protein KVR01_012907 [Diaporthe batatas]KAG8157199.1 hypothetical protein KVR01_012907 [Diaporthe batatas]